MGFAWAARGPGERAQSLQLPALMAVMSVAADTKDAVDGDGDGALTAMLVRLRRNVLEDGQGLRRRVHRHLLASTAALLSIVALTLSFLWDCLSSESRDPLFLFFGAFSCANSAAVFRTRGGIFLDAFDEAIALSRAVERSPRRGQGVQEQLGALARWCGRLLALYRGFTFFAICSLVYNMVMDREHLSVMFLFKLYACTAALLAQYTLLPLLVIMYAVIANLFVAAAEPVRVRGGAACTVTCGVMCNRLQQLCRRVDNVCGPLYPLVLLCSLLMPLVSLAEIVRTEGQVSLRATGTMPALFIILVPLCVGGQNIENSSHAVGWRCYEGPWLTETVLERRFRFSVMQMTSVESCVHVYRLAKLNKHTCLESLRRWFSFFQMLLNLRDQ